MESAGREKKNTNTNTNKPAITRQRFRFPANNWYWFYCDAILFPRPANNISTRKFAPDQ